MAYQAKTRELEEDALSSLSAIEPPARQEDALRLLSIFTRVTGRRPKLWTGGIVGFGRYRYRYDSGHEGQAPVTGFAMRRQAISLYTWLSEAQRLSLLPRLGKHRTGVGCIYVNRLSDIDTGVLEEIIRAAQRGIEARWPVDEEQGRESKE